MDRVPHAEDVARAALFALTQPPRQSRTGNELLLRPTSATP